MPVAQLGSISLDCEDPATLAAFWAALLGGQVAYQSEEFVAVRTPRGWLTAVKVPGYLPPTWPQGPRPKQVHLDLSVDDLDQASAEALRLGAHEAPIQPAPERWRVLLDPAGHPFCLSTQIPD